MWGILSCFPNSEASCFFYFEYETIPDLMVMKVTVGHSLEINYFQKMRCWICFCFSKVCLRKFV